MKICRICKIEKDITKFRKGKTYKDGRDTRCYSCRNKLRKEYPINLGIRISRWKTHAKNRRIEWALKKEDFDSMPLICYYTNQVLTLEENKQNTVSLDRIDSSKGYVKGNIVFCLCDINFMKSNLDLNYFYHLCEIIVKNKKIPTQLE